MPPAHAERPHLTYAKLKRPIFCFIRRNVLYFATIIENKPKPYEKTFLPFLGRSTRIVLYRQRLRPLETSNTDNVTIGDEDSKFELPLAGIGCS